MTLIDAGKTNDYRKRPVVIQAFRLGFEDPAAIPWAAVAIENGTISIDGDKAVLKTLEGYMNCWTGDWVIRGVKGEIYSCHHDIFCATYQPATDPQPEVTHPVTWSEQGAGMVGAFNE